MTADLKKRIHPVPGIKPVVMPCWRCGLEITHQACEPLELAELVFRATLLFDRAWLPVKHSHVFSLCPDPPPETEHFWQDRARREAWKAAHRAKGPSA